MLPILSLRRPAVHRQISHFTRDIDAMRVRIFKLLILLCMLISVHVFIISVAESLGIWDSVWLTLTTLTTVGYGDYAAVTPLGRSATILLLYSAGIALLARTFGEYIDYRVLRREYMASGRWRWKMKNHVVIVNSPNVGGAFYLKRLIKQMRQTPKLADMSIQLLTSAFPDGLPQELRELGVVHYHDSAFTRESLQAVYINDASYIVVLASDPFDIRADSTTYDLLGHFRDLKVKGRVVVESVMDENRQRFFSARANSVLRPIRAYPELLVRAMVAPGTERLLENLFIHHGDHATRYEVTVDNVKWHLLACGMIKNDLGTPLGYIRSDGELVCNPPSDENVHATALIVVVDSERVPTYKQVSQFVARLMHKHAGDDEEVEFLG